MTSTSGVTSAGAGPSTSSPATVTPGSAAAEPAGLVAVWRNEWLAPSETFVLQQMTSLRRWRSVSCGLTDLPDGIHHPDVVAPRVRIPRRRYTRPLRQRIQRRALGRAMADRGVDLIHAHFGPDATTALPIAEAQDLPLLATFHGFDVTSWVAGNDARTREYRARLRDVFAYATSLLAVSEHIGRRLLELGAPPDKVHVQYTGTPLRQPAPPRTREGILFVGRLVPKKGVEDLIRAVAGLGTPWSRVPVTVIGYGPLQAPLTALAHDLGVDARFVGRADVTAVRDAMAAARVLAVPSKTADDGATEGLPTVILEAGAEGTPTVGTRHAGIPEAVVDHRTGLLVDEGDIDALGQALRTVLADDTLAARLGDAARHRVQRHFDMAVCTQSLEERYDAARAAHRHGVTS